MPIDFVTGDIFHTSAQTIAHGCNCRGRMGAGIALDIKRRYPAMFKEYRRMCYKREFKPGDHFLYTQSTPWILNLATQDSTGGAKLQYVEQCLDGFCRYYEQQGIDSLALPRIGAGLGGLEWGDVKGLIIETLGELPISIKVYEAF